VELTPAQTERVDATLRFAQSQLSKGAREREAKGLFDRALWDEAASFGLAGLPIPEEWGGSGLDVVDTMLVIEALGKGSDDGGLVFSLCAHMFASAVPLWRSKSKPLQEKYLRDMAAGKLICANGTTEPEAGSDVYAMKTTADLFLLYAATSPERKFLGISAFLVPKDTPGLRVAPEHAKTGLRTSPWGTLYLEQCEVPESARVGPEGCGAALFAESMIWERGCLFAYYVGAMAKSLERCVEHVQNRSQFGQRLSSFQSVSNRLVDMKLRLEVSRLLLYRAGELHRAGKRTDEAAALSKLWISEAAIESGLDAIQIFGASGITADTGVDALLRDAVPSRIFSGTSEMQRNIIARMMGLK
jgi:alkylation response protein AidB-like acyl-CoA dehydrogenase